MRKPEIAETSVQGGGMTMCALSGADFRQSGGFVEL